MLPHLNAAYNLARWLAGNDQDAQDIVQESYLRAFRFFDGFKGGGDGKAWLLAVVRNTSATWRRREKGTPTVSFDEEVHGSRNGLATAEETLVEDVEFGKVRECLESLPAEYRGTVIMRELEEMPYRQIAEVCGVPLGTVMSRLARGRKRLLDCVAARMRRVAR